MSHVPALRHVKEPISFRELRLWWQNWGEGIVPAFADRGLAHLYDVWRLWRWMRELLARGKNTIDPEVSDPGGQSVEDSPWKVTLPFLFVYITILYSPAQPNKPFEQQLSTLSAQWHWNGERGVLSDVKTQKSNFCCCNVFGQILYKMHI
jgi:hypothetical protein